MKRLALLLILWASPALALTPTTPTNVVATGVRCHEIDVTWTASTVGPPEFIYFYDVYRDGTTVACTGSAGTSCHDSDPAIVPGSAHNYTVVAQTNQAHRSATSDTAGGTATTPCADTTPPSAPTGLNMSTAAHACTQQSLNWTLSTDTGGAGMDHYEIYENGQFYDRTFLDVGQLSGTSGRAPGLRYIYKVRGIDKDWNYSSFSSDLTLDVNCDANPITGTIPVGVFPVKFSDRAAEPLSQAQLTAKTSTDPDSWKAWISEVSYGQATLTPTVGAWIYTLPHAVLFYCSTVDANGYGLNCNVQGMRTDALALIGDTSGYQETVLYYNALAGAFAGGNTLTVGTDFFNLDTLAHETSHGLAGSLHAGSYDCTGEPDRVGPSMVNILSGSGCSIGRYADPTDTMGSNTHQFNTYHRSLWSWITQARVRTVTKSGDYTLDAREVSSSGTQEIRIPLGIHGTFYFFNFIKPTGFDSDLVEGVYAYLHPNAHVFSDGSGIITFSDDDTYILGQHVKIATFTDGYRSVTVQHLSTNGNTATVRITMNAIGPNRLTGKATHTGKVAEQ